MLSTKNINNYSLAYNIFTKNTPILINLPHSGRNYEDRFLEQTNVDIKELRYAEDAFLDKLVNNVSSNYSTLIANFPRVFVDVNRSPLEIDACMWESNKIIENISKRTDKVIAGFGVFPKNSFNGHAIYNKKLKYSEARYRLLKYYFPYHRQIKNMINKKKQLFKNILVIDLHSMASDIIYPEVDIVLSNYDGVTADNKIFLHIKKLFNKYDLKVELNNPFKGGFISQFYGKPKNNVHIIQVEINKQLYMREKEMILNKKKSKSLEKKIQKIFNDLYFYMTESN